MNGHAQAQRAYDAQRPPEFYDYGREAREQRAACLTAAEQFLRVLQRGDPLTKLPTVGAVKNTPLDTLLTYLSKDCAKQLLAACAQALKRGASLGTAERFAQDRVTADLLRTFMAAMAAEYADDNVEAWL